MDKIGLLDDVQDLVTGFEGCVIGIVRWAYRPPTLIVQSRDPQFVNDEGVMLDESRVKVIKHYAEHEDMFRGGQESEAGGQ